ncbi:MAG: hapE2 [Solirubrobacterales bacterium]|nr:hapE2 [Solirubrobacterales bacterium]
MRVAIIGAGFAGLGMAIRLKQEGEHDFVVLERADSVGGTWRDNSYPGCAVDVQSHLYSFSFAPNPDWSHLFSPQQEIWDYQQRLVREHGLESHLRLGHEVLGGEWDADAARWRLQTSAGPVEAAFLVSGMGPLSNPIPPDIPGLESFAGTCFHSARWEHEHPIAGRRVAVIGTGSSAAQFVPAIAPEVERLVLFQRTPGWIIPRFNRRITRLERLLYRRFPAVQRAVRKKQMVQREGMGLVLKSPVRAKLIEAVCRARLKQQVPDPVLREKLTPTYRAGCKRIIVADDWYPALGRPNVDVVTDAITEVVPEGVRTADGTVHAVDTLILGTGFEIMPVADPLRGRDGVPLAERWAGGREAYLGTAVAGYPNYFMLVGPNTGTGHTSVLLYAEAQIEYVLQCLAHVARTGARSIEVREERQRAYSAGLREQLDGTVWLEGGCRSWYLDAGGGSSVLWPGTTFAFTKLLAQLDPADYVLDEAPAREPVAA